MSIFSETIAKAIGDYRKLLRRYLEQEDRLEKLRQLNLKDLNKGTDDLILYNKALEIIDDIKHNMDTPDQGYYGYSGLHEYSKYLQQYLDNYELDGMKVVHRAQHASKALIQAIQLAMLPDSRLDEAVEGKFEECSKLVAEFGSEEQKQLYRDNLERQTETNAPFYSKVLQGFEQLLFPRDAEAA